MSCHTLATVRFWNCIASEHLSIRCNALRSCLGGVLLCSAMQWPALHCDALLAMLGIPADTDSGITPRREESRICLSCRCLILARRVDARKGPRRCPQVQPGCR